ncbi:hypothetical protein BJY21_003762 [Kineosphaera limosa]|uniref:DUF3499 domain-containing protein n=1 Tax=Kineosphaera limosa NBRC 100340 TaxID=1184609 RepID=K6XF20_9MICO|nr:hypothetical protein [Kineosphaera limosa]GAB97409.1 hypothetical protein KILIM_067_00100 [Kineosphaera limosa NBRC 100340]
MSLMRRCSRTACPRPAVATLTYVYADSTAVLGPLATFAEPHTYDLCGEHAERLTAPRGWEVVRLVSRFEDLPVAQDDLLAVADAVREETVRDRSARQAPAARRSAVNDSGSSHSPYPGYSGYSGYSGRHRGTQGEPAGEPGPSGEAPERGPAMSRAAGYPAPAQGGRAWSGTQRGHLRSLRPTSAGSTDL